MTKVFAIAIFRQDLSNILCPVLIICGKKDIANKKAAKALAKNISYARLCLIDNAGHEVNRTAPEKLAKELLRMNFADDAV